MARLATTFLFLVLVGRGSLLAQLPLARLLTVFPPGGKMGSQFFAHRHHRQTKGGGDQRTAGSKQISRSHRHQRHAGSLRGAGSWPFWNLQPAFVCRERSAGSHRPDHEQFTSQRRRDFVGHNHQRPFRSERSGFLQVHRQERATNFDRVQRQGN